MSVKALLQRKGSGMAVTDPGQLQDNDPAFGKAAGLIIESINRDLYSVVRDLYENVAPNDMIEALRVHFNRRCGNNLIFLKTKLWSLELRPGQSIATLHDEISILERRCGAQGSVVLAADKTAILLKAISTRSDFEPFLTQINAEIARLPDGEFLT